MNTLRIVSFGEVFKDISFLTSARKNILWPCYAWKVAFPIRGSNRLNPFEELVLKLSAQGLCNAEAVANFCYPTPEGENFHPHVDLITCIHSRLLVRGYMDSRWNITAEGKNLLDEWDSEEQTLRPAIVYQDMDSGKLLPAVNFGDQIYSEQTEKNEFKIAVDKSIKAQIVEIQGKEHPPPSGMEIIRIYNKFIERYNRYISLRGSTIERPPSFSFDSVPKVSGEKELIHLHCQVIMQEGYREPQVSDGFGLGYFDSFLKYLNSKDPPWFRNFKNQALVDNASGEPESDKKKMVAFIPFRLKKTLETIEKWKNKPPDSPSAKREIKGAIKFGAESLYDVLEYAFASLRKKYPADDWIKVVSKGRFGEYKDEIRESAYQLGFNVTEKNSRLFDEAPGSFLQIYNGTNKLQPLLIIAIMAAGKDGNKYHPCRALANNFPDFLDFAYKLKSIRDPIKHGDSPQEEIDIAALEELYNNTKKVVDTLSPDYDQTEEITVSGDMSYEQSWRRAVNKLETEFGLDLFNSFDNNLQETLYDLEMFPDGIIINIASALQITLHSLNKTCKDLSKQEYSRWLTDLSSEITRNAAVKELRNHAQDRAREYGFIQAQEQLPQGIMKVNETSIPLMFRGGKKSLRAECFALLVFGSGDTLAVIAQRIPKLLEFVDNIATVRIHGHRAYIDKAKSEELKATLYDAMKKLLEVM